MQIVRKVSGQESNALVSWLRTVGDSEFLSTTRPNQYLLAINIRTLTTSLYPTSNLLPQRITYPQTFYP